MATQQRKRQDKRPRLHDTGSGDDGNTDDDDIEGDDADDNDDSPPMLNLSSAVSPHLSSTDVVEHNNAFMKHCDQLLVWLGNDRDSKRKVKIRGAVEGLIAIYNSVTSASSSVKSVNDSFSAVKSSIDSACASVIQASNQLSSLSGSALQTGRSFAGVVAQSVNTNNTSPAVSSRARKVVLPRGKTFPILNSSRVVIGPVEHAKLRFPSSADTKKTLFTSINPTQMKISVNRVSLGPSSSVILEGKAINSATLSSCSGLAEAGLEIKPDVKLKPRIIIHDIPTDLSADDVVACLIDQNLPDTVASDYKAIYTYPAREKKFRSCVIETSPDIRAALLNRHRVYVNWSRCRVDDHVTILQCFNCCSFGHVASNCTKNVVCGKCSGTHATKQCPLTSTLRCVNCVAAKIAGHNHAATDRDKCPIILRKIQRKIANTEYGEQ